jgi:hypothetical protein
VRTGLRWAVLGTAFVAVAGCGVMAGGRYRDALQKLKKQKPGSTTPATCESAVAGVKCVVLPPALDVSDLVGLSRDVGGLDPRRAGPAQEDAVYYQKLLDNTTWVDAARHGPEGLYPGLPFYFEIKSLDPTFTIEKAHFTIHSLGENQVAGVTWWLARMRRGVVQAKIDDNQPKPAAGVPPTLADADFGNDPVKMFDGLKYLGFRSKAFDGKTYVEHLGEAGFLDAKIEEAQREKDSFTFDVTAAVAHAQEDKLPGVLFFLAPKVARAPAAEGDPTYLFLATRAGAESLRPGLAVEYREPPPPDPEEEKKKAEAEKKAKKAAAKKK